ncbi:DUF5776 domain-containing protein [Lentilactobacillus hilgardii]|uniref:DUF5776 domain-containing protein n=1 Tax=Lentilactobacillus hilgardii TaxID=1588 RepID=UPI0039EB02B9
MTTIVNQATAQDAINAANKDSSKLQDAKDAADKAIDGMTNLSSDQKKQFKSDVDSAKDAAGVQTALDQAAAANKSTVTTDLTAAKKAATDKIAKMNLTDAQKTAFNKAVNAATDQAGIDSAISQAQAQAAINDANNDASKLADAKAAAKTAIDGMTNLSDAQKTQYKSDVDNAKDAAGVQKALDAAETANNSGSTTDLTAAKKTATDTINGLKNLTAAEDAAYLKAVDAANSQDSITTLVNQAKAQDALNAAVNDASKLADAKTAAKSAIDSMSNLIADKKTQYKSDVDKATTVAGVQTVLDAAAEANKSTVTPDLTAAKKTASDTINGLKNLTSDQTAAYLKAVDAANSQAGIDTAVAQAKAQDAVNAANNDASKLADAKTAAKSAIDGMTNLTADQKTTFKSDVDKATDAAGVQKALDAAETANNSGSTTDLTAAKKTATDKIAKMNLTDDQKTAYNKAVNAATDQAGIDTAVAQAQAQSDINDAAGDSGAAALKAVKAAAKDAINVFPYLTDAEKTAFNTQIDNAKDIDSVNTIVQNASDQNTKNASSQTGDALATAKTQAKNTIAKLANLTSDEQSSFTSAVDNATTTNEVQSIVSQAQAQDALNKAEKDNTAASLTAAKTSAKTAIDEMPYLTSTQASQYKSDVDSAKDATGVQTVLDKAKAQNDANKAASTATALAKAKTDAKATINALTNLSSAEKTSFTAAVDAATDIATVQQIVSQAQTQDANDKAQNDNSTAVKNAKTSAENAVDGLTNLSTQQKQDIKSQIEKATDVASIITLLKNAMDLDAQIAKNNAATTTPSTTTSSSSSSTTSSSSSSSSTPTSSTSTNTGTSSSSEKVGTAIYATKKIYLYKNPTFKKSERVATYGTKPRVNRPMFVITGTAKSSNGALRYKVRDVNHGSSTYGKTGYITARSSYVSSVYYAGLPSSKKVTIVSPKGVNAYKNASLTGSATHYKQGTVLRVKAIKTHNQTTRFELSNGKFITANKKFVMTGTHARASRVRVKRAIKLYRTANLTGAKRTIKAGKTLAVKGWTYSHATATKTHGTKRYIVSGGYITASSHYVKVTRTTR